MNEKSPEATPCGLDRKARRRELAAFSLSTARTMASRQVSVRDSAQEFHIAGRPVLGVEVPAHAPDRHGGRDDRGKRQARLKRRD